MFSQGGTFFDTLYGWCRHGFDMFSMKSLVQGHLGKDLQSSEEITPQL